jgi:serine/threonine protein kinase
MPDPKLYDISDDEYPFQVLIHQISWFGPIPQTYANLLPDEDDNRWNFLGEAVSRIEHHNAWKPFCTAQDVTHADKKFLCKIMKLDPRDRPTAAELLHDEWFLEM